MSGGFLLLLCVKPRSVKESWHVYVEYMDWVILFVVLRAQGLSHWVFSRVLVINDIKLRYLCCNKLPRIIFILMNGDDYVINTLLIRPRVRR